jgi:Ca2+-binding EF-hand superfamily protein
MRRSSFLATLAFAALTPALSLAQSAPAAATPDDPAAALQKRMLRAPDAFLSDAAELILGYGTAGAIDQAGIDKAIAVAQAGVRAREWRRLMLADLDGDGSAAPEEVAVLVQAASAASRGRLTLLFEGADTDRDGTVTRAEMESAAHAAVQRPPRPGREAMLSAMLTLDGNSDGQLTLEEVRTAITKAKEGS